MKKVISLVCLFCFLLIPSVEAIDKSSKAEQSSLIVEPKWEDYVPKKYLEPRDDFRRGSCIAELVSGIVLTDLVFTSPIGIPMIYHATTKLKNLSYAEKKEKFFDGLEIASSISDPQEKSRYYKSLLKSCKFSKATAKKVKKQNERDAIREKKRLEREKQKELKRIEKQKKKVPQEL